MSRRPAGDRPDDRPPGDAHGPPGPGAERGLLPALALALVGVTAVAAGTLVGPVGPAPAGPAPRTVSLPGTDTVLACTGPAPAASAALGGDRLEGDAEVDADALPAVSAVRGLAGSPVPGAVAPTVAASPLDDVSPGDQPGTEPGSGAGTDPVVPPSAAAPQPGTAVASATGPAALRVGGTGAVADLAALSTSRTGDGELRGLAASGCAEPAAESWVLGGQAGAGRSAQLVVANPGGAPAAVRVEVLTADGPVEGAAGDTVAVAPGAQRRVLLEALAPGAGALAVRVVAEGAPVAATVQEVAADGLRPLGTEDVGPSDPATAHVLTGVDVAAGDAPVLRLAAPGTDDAVVSWRVLGPDGPRPATDAPAVTVPAGAVVDVPLDGQAAGVLAVAVDADVPVLAAVRTSHGDPDGPQDLAVTAPAAALGRTATLAAPADPEVDARLVLAAPGDEDGDVEVVAVGVNGRQAPGRRVRVAAGGTAVVPAADLAAEGGTAGWRLRSVSGGPVHAALALTATAADGGPTAAVVPGREPVTAPPPLEVAPAAPGRWP